MGRRTYHTQEWWKMEMSPAKKHQRYIREVASIRGEGLSKQHKKQIAKDMQDEEFFHKMDKEYEAQKVRQHKEDQDLNALVDELFLLGKKKD